MSDNLNKNQYLLNFRKNIASQFGEDGIIERIFEIIPESNKWCVEFGAWDGKFCSNTYNLIANNAWSGVLIEGNANKIEDLKNTYKGNSKVFPLNKYVHFAGKDILDNILTETPIPQNFDLLSVDIDGNDYHIWKAVTKYRPKVVLIEYNAFIPNDIEFIQPANMKLQQGHSILSITKLANEKGYELICINQENAFFVDKKYFSLFNIEDNSIDELKHFKAPLQVFQLYDGTIVFHGSQALYYCNLPVDFNKHFQVLPHYLRKSNFVWSNSIFRFVFGFYRRFIYRQWTKMNKKDVLDYCWSWKAEYKSFSKQK
jgi:hypothetical protein